MTYGIYQRVAPRVNVLSGYWGNEPFMRKHAAPVTSGTTILSGQLISLTSGAWVLGCTAGKEPYIAWHDSSDTDVTSSGKLLGLSCSGQYTIETPWFDNTQTYVESSPLKAATGGSGTSLVAPLTAAAGALTLGTLSTAEDTVGFAKSGGRQTISGINSESACAYVLQFVTHWLPKATTSS